MIRGNFTPSGTTRRPYIDAYLSFPSIDIPRFDVKFLVDTGASVVALSAREADGLGLDYLNGTKGSVQTAQGVANSYFLMLDEVVVGGITAHNVQAAVIEGAYPVEILLGMSFLRQVALHEQGGVLTLTAKY